jgi:hypothetical protein
MVIFLSQTESTPKHFFRKKALGNGKELIVFCGCMLGEINQLLIPGKTVLNELHGILLFVSLLKTTKKNISIN